MKPWRKDLGISLGIGMLCIGLWGADLMTVSAEENSIIIAEDETEIVIGNEDETSGGDTDGNTNSDGNDNPNGNPNPDGNDNPNGNPNPDGKDNLDSNPNADGNGNPDGKDDPNENENGENNNEENNPEAEIKEGFIVENQKTYYYEDGKKVTGEKYIKDEATGKWSWYYFMPDADGEMDTEWSWIPSNGGKWCYYDKDGRMIYGQQYIDGHWYMFDKNTGATQYGFVYIPEETKWVFYDRVMGWMLYGEQYIDDGWYYLTPGTGAIDYEWAWIPEQDKWVYYDPVSGRMQYGEHKIGDKWEYFDTTTGKVLKKNEKIDRLVKTAYGSVGKHIDCPGILAANGGILCPYGPCMSYVWWIYYESGMTGHVADGAKTGWPHHNYDWYKSRGRVDYKPQVGDIAFFRYPWFADVEGVSSSHAGFVVGVNGNYVTVIDALSDGIRPRVYSVYSTVGFAHPYYE